MLLRAPLWPIAALDRDARALFREPLARAALRLASPRLVDERGAKADRARANFARRAAFRATPHGLWAGAAVATLGEKTRIATGEPRAHVTVSWARLASLGRALLDDPARREQAQLRHAPSLLRDADRIAWLKLGEPLEREAEVDDALARVLDATREWRSWPFVRDQVGADDEWLLLLVDEGLLTHDLEPPLVGPPPLDWMAAHVPELGEVAAALERDDLDGAQERLDALPGTAERSFHATLVHQPSAAVIARAAVERAAAIAALLYRLQQALMPPARERALQPLDETVDAVGEIFGEGAFELAALALGGYGTALPTDEPAPPAPSLSPIAAQLFARIASAGDTLALASDELVLEGDVPDSFELQLAPMREARGKPAGDGWLLGVHAPAGASWGRFAHALGAQLDAALAELAAAERDRRVDVAFAPSAELADLTTHPPLRAQALALHGWPPEPLLPSSLSLAIPDLALQDLAGTLMPSPLHRVRSTTAPPGAFRLLAGFSLWRQHAPWALALGPLDALDFVPRILLDGFVISPRSWKIPPLANRAALARWRREAKLPGAVQVGREDELLLVDLDAPDAHELIAKSERAWEVWPPLDATPDADGRRIELIAAVVGDSQPRAPARSIAPPSQKGPAAGWRTWKLFGARDRATRLLLHVAALVRGRARWFFLPYVDGPGRREHLRLRVLSPDAGLERAIAVALDEGRAAGDLISVESADWFPERGRFGEDAIDAIERVFESDSELVCALHEAGLDADETDLLVASWDALAAGLGLSRAERRAFAQRRREAWASDEDDAWSKEFRTRRESLCALLANLPPPIAEHKKRVAVARVPRPNEQIASLLHLAAVRLAGPDRLAELRANYFWERALESLEKRVSR
jgi:thiopeptide-type bacteriocin biosynthesis protein